MYTNSIITSLYAYSSSLFIGDINGGITSFELPSKWFKKSRAIQPYHLEILSNEKFIKDMQAYKGILFVSTPNYIYSFDLKNDYIQNETFKKNVDRCTMIKIDYTTDYLFAASEERGLVAIKISNPRKPKFKIDINYERYFNGDTIITDMDVSDNVIFLAIRNLGIMRIDYIENEFQGPIVTNKFEKISLEDPQDVKFNKNNEYLHVADSEKGLIILDTRNNRVIYEAQLPNMDSPKKIIIYNRDSIVQGSRGLYYFDIKQKQFRTIFDFKIGAITKYYNKIMYTKNNELNLLFLGNVSEDVIKDSYNEYSAFKDIYSYSNKALTKIK